MVNKLVFDPGAETAEDDIDYIQVDWPIAPAQRFEVLVPSPGQVMHVIAQQREGGGAAIAAVLNLFKGIFPPEGYKRITEYLDDPRYRDSDGKIIDFFFQLVEEFGANPPTTPTGSSASSSTGGRTSTANKPRPASTRARSRSRVSSISPDIGS